MSDDEKPIAIPSGQDAMRNSPNSMIEYVLAGFASLPDEGEVQEGELETTGSALTEADRRALAALGSSAEVAARVMAGARLGRKMTERSTRMEMEEGVPTCAAPDARPEAEQPNRSFDELMKSMHASQQEKEVSWRSCYRKIKELGRGGQGIVYLAECVGENSFPMAMKVFSPEPYGDAQAYCDDMARMAHMASLIYRIQHDNLLDVERFASYNGIHTMVMRWIDGHDLRYLLQPSLFERLRGCVAGRRWQYLNDVVANAAGTPQLRMKPAMAVNIVDKCLRALDALHGQGIVHGDIKPSNIMLDCFGSIRLIDIGSAFEIEAPPRQHTWTPQYAAPEVLAHGERSRQSDLASMGYVLVEMLSGQPIAAGAHGDLHSTRIVDDTRDGRLLEAKLRLPAQLEELLPADVRRCEHLMNLCRRLIDPDPGKRFSTANVAQEGEEGTFQFNTQLARGHLNVHYANEIARWLADVNRAEQS